MFTIFFECLYYSLNILLFSECYFYSVSFCFIIRLFVLLSVCLCYSPDDSVILRVSFSVILSMFFYCFNVYILLWLCLTFICWQVSRRLPIAETLAQSHGDPYGICDDVRRIVCLSCIDRTPFPGTCDSDCEHRLEMACLQAFLKSALEFSVKYIIPPSGPYSLATAPEACTKTWPEGTFPHDGPSAVLLLLMLKNAIVKAYSASRYTKFTYFTYCSLPFVFSCCRNNSDMTN